MEPLSITFRGMEPPIGVEDDIRNRVAELGRFFDRITACHVVVEARHRHQRHGGLYHVHIDLSVPERTIVAGREPVSKYEFGNLVARALGYEVGGKPSSVNGMKPKRAESLGLNVDRAERLLKRALPTPADVAEALV